MTNQTVGAAVTYGAAVALLSTVSSCAQQGSATSETTASLTSSTSLSVTASAAPVPKRPEILEFDLDKASDTVVDLKIVRVRLSPKETTVVLRYQTNKANKRLRVYPPGHKSAFYIVPTTEATKRHLLNVNGVAIAPEATSISPGVPVEFTLSFEKLSPDTTSFHLIEGESDPEHPVNNQKFIRFMNVALGTPTRLEEISP